MDTFNKNNINIYTEKFLDNLFKESERKFEEFSLNFKNLINSSKNNLIKLNDLNKVLNAYDSKKFIKGNTCIANNVCCVDINSIDYEKINILIKIKSSQLLTIQGFIDFISSAYCFKINLSREIFSTLKTRINLEFKVQLDDTIMGAKNFYDIYQLKDVVEFFKNNSIESDEDFNRWNSGYKKELTKKTVNLIEDALKIKFISEYSKDLENQNIKASKEKIKGICRYLKINILEFPSRDDMMEKIKSIDNKIGGFNVDPLLKLICSSSTFPLVYFEREYLQKIDFFLYMIDS